MDQVKIVEDNLWKIWSDMICLSRPYPLKFFKDCLPQFLLGPFLNNLIQIWTLKPKEKTKYTVSHHLYNLPKHELYLRNFEDPCF